MEDDDIESFVLIFSFLLNSIIVNGLLASIVSLFLSDDFITQPLFEFNSLFESSFILPSELFGLFKFNKLLSSFTLILSLSVLILFIFPVSLDSDKLGDDGLESYFACGALIVEPFFLLLLYVGESRRLSIL